MDPTDNTGFREIDAGAPAAGRGPIFRRRRRTARHLVPAAGFAAGAGAALLGALSIGAILHTGVLGVIVGLAIRDACSV